MAGIQRVMVVAACGCLMALAALAGQIGYGDDYGRNALPGNTAAVLHVRPLQVDGMSTVDISRDDTERL